MKSGIKMKVDKKKQWSKDCSNKIEVKISLKLSNYFSFRKHKFLTNLPTFFFQNGFLNIFEQFIFSQFGIKSNIEPS